MIELKNVSKKYGNNYVVDNISFTVQNGEIVGFLGKNGAGKTTTMNMITGYLDATSGDIIVNGYDIKKSPVKVKSQIGYMPEGVPIYLDLTVREFINYIAELRKIPKSKRKKEVDKVIEITGLKEVQKSLNRNLSRGYKQRVGLASALVGSPPILILDEPTIGLDPKQVTEIRELIKSLKDKHTVILSSHILSEISQICDKVIIIDKGKIVAVDSPQNLEDKALNYNVIILTIEDKNNKFDEIKIEDVTCKKLINSNDNGKTYEIICNSDKDIRKRLFEICAKENITIIEMKKKETSLEDAFIKIVEN